MHSILPNRNAYFLFKHLRNAELVLYPDSGHGALFQYPERFVNHVGFFLTENTLHRPVEVPAGAGSV